MRYIVIASLLFLSGCGHSPNFKTKPAGPMVDKTVGDITEVKRFVFLEKGVFNERPFGAITMVNNAQPSGPLMAPMNASFQGPLEDLIKVTAKKIGYSVRKYGERPGAVILVSVNRPDSSAYAIMEEGVLQSQGWAKLTIDQNRRSLTLRYKRPERSPVPHIEDTRL